MQITMRYYYYILDDLKCKKKKKNKKKKPNKPKLSKPSVDKNSEQMELPYTADGNVELHNCLENSLAIFYKIKPVLTIWYDPGTPSLGINIYLREMKTYLYTKTCA